MEMENETRREPPKSLPKDFWEFVRASDVQTVGIVTKSLVCDVPDIPMNVNIIITAFLKEIDAKMRSSTYNRRAYMKSKSLNQSMVNTMVTTKSKIESKIFDDNVVKNTEIAENSQLLSRECAPSRDDPHNNIYNIYNNNNMCVGGVGGVKSTPMPQNAPSASKMAEPPKPKKEAERIPPTVEMVAAYCAKVGATFSPQAFIDFYESKGWVVGKTRMKNWQAAVRTWMRMDKETRAPHNGSVSRPASNQSVGYIHQEAGYKNRLLSEEN